jgi:hypothetical protein
LGTRGKRHQNLKGREVDGPEGLLCAILRQVVDDVRHPHPAPRPTQAGPTFGQTLQAIEWLLDGEELSEFASLIGLDADWLTQELRLQAGLAEGTPRVGQRRSCPLPKQTRTRRTR